MTTPVVDRGGRRAYPDGSAGRLPAPTRHRRPALAALAVLLIVGGALVSGLIALRSGERTDYVVLRRTVDVGQRIDRGDLGVARIAGEGARAIPAADLPRLVGQFATTRVYEGTLATHEMFSAKQQVPAGSAVVGAVLSAEQRPARALQVGDIVAVYVVPRLDDAGGEAILIVRAAAVVEVVETRAAGGSGLAVSLLVDDDHAADVTLNAALHKIAVAKLPPDTNPEVPIGGAG
jgi:hypothetical protein